jgi:hypothetical protein
MDPTIKLYQAMRAALRDGHTMDEVNREIARRGFQINGVPGTFDDLSNRFTQIMDAKRRGPVTLSNILGSMSHAATLGADKFLFGASEGFQPEPGSPESRLADYLRPRDWLRELDAPGATDAA